MKNLYFLFISLLIIKLINAQCDITASGTPLQICLGEYISLYSSGNCIDTIISNDFNNQTIGSGWTSNFNPLFNNPCGIGDGTPHMWVDTSVSYPRYITSPPCSVTDWCEICFDMVYAIDGQSPPCEGPDLVSEGIHLQYSTNGGVTWTDINYWVPTNPWMNSWINLCEDVPVAATSANTKFQWYQDVTSGNDQDAWGIDNVKIFCITTSVSLQWSNNFDSWTYSDFNPPSQFPPTGTWEYIVTLTDSVYIDSDTITVTVLEPPIVNFTFNNNVCEDSVSISLSATPSGGTFSGPGVIGNLFYPDSAGGIGQYTISYVASNFCDTIIDTVNITVTNCVGVDEINKDNSISIFPNPTTGKIRIEAEGVESIEVINLQGKQIYTGKETEIDLKPYSKGIYIIKVTTNKGVAVEKVVLE